MSLLCLNLNYTDIVSDIKNLYLFELTERIDGAKQNVTWTEIIKKSQLSRFQMHEYLIS